MFVTGSPMREVLEAHKEQIAASDVLARLNLAPKQYFLLSAHREENIDNEANFLSLMNAVNGIAERYGLPVIYSTHPRSRKFIEQRGFQFHPLVRSLKPFGYFDYNKLQQNAACVLSDSGTLSEESALLGFPAVLIRTSTERPEVLDAGTIVIGGIEEAGIEQAIAMAVDMAKDDVRRPLPQDYLATNVSEKVMLTIQSYTDIVNRTTWGKI